MKHTPGPWAIGIETDNDQAQIISADGWHLASVALDPLPANARLIAAAPDLLEALEDVAEWLSTGKCDGVGFDEESVLDVIRAAIARSKGK
jgi:hypothetical protein